MDVQATNRQALVANDDIQRQFKTQPSPHCYQKRDRIIRGDNEEKKNKAAS